MTRNSNLKFHFLFNQIVSLLVFFRSFSSTEFICWITNFIKYFNEVLSRTVPVQLFMHLIRSILLQLSHCLTRRTSFKSIRKFEYWKKIKSVIKWQITEKSISVGIAKEAPNEAFGISMVGSWHVSVILILVIQ